VPLWAVVRIQARRFHPKNINPLNGLPYPILEFAITARPGVHHQLAPAAARSGTILQPIVFDCKSARHEPFVGMFTVIIHKKQ
jgi:hypothetical protein